MGSKTAYHHGDLRNALVDAGLRLLERVGIEAFSLREVAREVGVSPNAAYRHFEDKDALLMAMAVRGFERLAAGMQQAMSSARPKGAVRSRAVARFNAAGHAYIALAEDWPQLYGLMFGAAGRACLEAEDALQTLTPGAVLGGLLDELVDEEQISTRLRPGAELRVWSAVHGFAALRAAGPFAALTSAARAEALRALLAFVVAGLRGADA